MKLKYIGPLDSADVLVGDTIVTVQRNHQFEVPDDIAGRAPDPRLDDVARALVDAQTPDQHHERARLAHEYAGLDKGEGLLAQSDNFTTVTKKADK